MITTCSDLSFFDEALEHIERGHVPFGLDRLFTGIHELRERFAPDAWRAFVETEARSHRVFELVQRCPMARHAYERPRGYAGDAELLDYLYRLRRPVEDSSVGYRIWDFTTLDRPAPLAVRKRRHALAAYLDDLIDRPRGRRRVLSVASGHLREALASNAVRDGLLDELVALDSDGLSLAEVDRSLGQDRVRSVRMSVRDLLRPGILDGPFDLVYSAGLYDYLEQPFAQRLTRELFARTAPGGRLLLCNFVPDLYDIGYMEIFMGWDLIYRDLPQLRDVAADLPADQVAGVRCWRDSHDAVAYLEILRAAD